ncbi:MAG: TetR/AcrR family transcriptional regulator [Methylococcaceae bacterium]|jgi:AcrR family transcriptional regulator
MIKNLSPEKLTARERILLTAHDLFYEDGIRATGIDKIIAQAKVTKVTFYRHFPSKNELIIAFLDYRHQLWLDWFKAALNRHTSDSAENPLMALVPALAEWFKNPIFRGCAFINSVAELGGSLAEVMRISSQHKQDMAEVIAQLLPESTNRGAIANAAAIAVDGAIVKAQLDVKQGTADTALAGLALLLQGIST